MSKKLSAVSKATIFQPADPLECPFREFRDQEILPEYWGMGTAIFRNLASVSKVSGKGAPAPVVSQQTVWMDEQTQPLPNSVRQYLHGWERAEDLARDRWGCEVVIFEESHHGKMSLLDIQLTHTQVLIRSSFCRRVFSYCYILERADSITIEHQWEGFSFALGPEGWRVKYHIYSPGTKGGGGVPHKPTLSKNGCYLVRLFYLGAWRCIWVSDQVPIDATGAPLLPFSPLSSPSQVKGKSIPAMMTSEFVHLWPLLLIKALLKIAVPDMTSDFENGDKNYNNIEDEALLDFDILHTLTGSMSVAHTGIKDPEMFWELLSKEVKMFVWDEDDENLSTSTKTKTPKKPNVKDKEQTIRRPALVTVVIKDTKNEPPYILPGITPCHEMVLVITMMRDLPLKKPSPEPDVAFWKTFRWVDWARMHGLYDEYKCPRTKFLKVNGLMKMSYATHLLDVQSTESITFCFREQQMEKVPVKKTGKEDEKEQEKTPQEEQREWILFESITRFVKVAHMLYFPSFFEFTSATSCPPIRVTKLPMRGIDVPAPKTGPLYFQIDGPEINNLKMSLNTLHPRVLLNCGIPIVDTIDKPYFLLERFEWFASQDAIPLAKAYIATRGYDTVEVAFKPGRHFCRLWVHSQLHWHVALMSETSDLLLGTRDAILFAAVRECSWAHKFLNNLGLAFSNWIKISRSTYNLNVTDRDFFSSYKPDLEWDSKLVGYDQAFVHWMFRAALQSFLSKRLTSGDYQNVCSLLQSYFLDPHFGIHNKSKPGKALREMIGKDPCDCGMPEPEDQMEEEERSEEPSAVQENQENEEERASLADKETMDRLLKEPVPPIQSQLCELATEEVPCAMLKIKREKMIARHEAATIIQAHWRGIWVRKRLSNPVSFSSEVYKLLMDYAFGNIEVLSALMSEFFAMFPGVKYAYSISSALTGTQGHHQYLGVTNLTHRCKWIPYFQGVFFCHSPVKVHFDIHSSLPNSSVEVYDNDTGLKCPQAYNAHITFNFSPNYLGYTVMGHGSLNKAMGRNVDVTWQFTVVSSVDKAFHICDNEIDSCTELPLAHSFKLHFDELFIPNRRNILGGIEISVKKEESVSFRAAATSPDLEMEAILRTVGPDGIMTELSRCSGKGEIYWPYISLTPMFVLKDKSLSTNNASTVMQSTTSTRSMKAKQQGRMKSKSITKLDPKTPPTEMKSYIIEVIAPNGWPLSIDQWKRVDEVRNSLEQPKHDTSHGKKSNISKTGSTKDKKEDFRPESRPANYTVPEPLDGDAFIELECSTTLGGGASARRDDERDILFAMTRRLWEMKDPGRNARGNVYRDEFRAEYLVPTVVAKSESDTPDTFEAVMEYEEEKTTTAQQGPSPVTESGSFEISIYLEEEEIPHNTMPEHLKDKFLPMYFVPLCTKEKSDEQSAILSDEMAEAAKNARHARLEGALERMRELQTFNERYILRQQKRRCYMLEKVGIDKRGEGKREETMTENPSGISMQCEDRLYTLGQRRNPYRLSIPAVGYHGGRTVPRNGTFIDASWNPDIHSAFEERDEAIARELVETLVVKKKTEVKVGPKK